MLEETFFHSGINIIEGIFNKGAKKKKFEILFKI
jgi:hypothetical protein